MQAILFQVLVHKYFGSGENIISGTLFGKEEYVVVLDIDGKNKTKTIWPFRSGYFVNTERRETSVLALELYYMLVNLEMAACFCTHTKLQWTRLYTDSLNTIHLPRESIPVGERVGIIENERTVPGRQGRHIIIPPKNAEWIYK